MAQFIDVLGVTAVVVALPAVGRDLHCGGQALQWIVSAYALCFGGFLLLAGRSADLLGRRRLFVLGLLAFGAASIACGAAASAPVLLGARAMQGASAAVVVPAALSLLTAAFPGGRGRVWALGVWTAAGAGGGAAGFLVGGVVTAAIGWRWLFLLNVPIAFLAAALGPRLLSESRGNLAVRLDVTGALLVTLGVGSTIAGLTLVTEQDVPLAAALLAVLAGIGALAAFVRVEARHDAPLAPPSLLRRRRIAGPAVVAFTLTATTSAAAILGTSYLQEVLKQPPTITGLIFLPFSGLVIAGSLLGSRILARLGGRLALVLGLAVLAAGMLAYTQVSDHGGIAAVVAGLAISGAALGWASVAATSIGMGGAHPSEQGLVAGILNTATQLGTAVGVAVIGGLAAARTASLAGAGAHAPGALVEGFHTGWLAGAGIAAACATFIALWGDWPPYLRPTAVRAGGGVSRRCASRG